ncbi:hypothetical protein AB205_0068520 [Aquarana catesbeiana]|uniref:Uncharacterized protein n=1 Tax=Aquarana catesbeiana TaxID=8400 RepID=A0A2G9QI56_AQUCT|nr:hypothetical protein AB205_0068520 [Aquarana catesbeiana]
MHCHCTNDTGWKRGLTSGSIKGLIVCLKCVFRTAGGGAFTRGRHVCSAGTPVPCLPYLQNSNLPCLHSRLSSTCVQKDQQVPWKCRITAGASRCWRPAVPDTQKNGITVLFSGGGGVTCWY